MGHRDVVDKDKSFKTDSSLTNYCYNLFTYFNKRCFRTGKWAGFITFDEGKIPVWIDNWRILISNLCF